MEDKIDFIILWVDGSDPEWQKEKQMYQEKSNQKSERLFKTWNTSKLRYRDWEILKYWFRSIEKFTPWVNKIHFVTCGHVPEWLNLDNPKLNFVKHSDFIPEKYLPTFNSNVIELNLHRIKGLSENFVIFNDDTFITKKMNREDFFKNDLPKNHAILNLIPLDSVGHSEFNNTIILNKYFEKNKVIKQNFIKWFNIKYFPQLIRTFLLMPWKTIPGLYEAHLPMSHKKKYFELMWQLEGNELDKTSQNKFRGKDDVNHWLMSDYYVLNGKFIPRSIKIGKHFEKKIDDEIVNAIKKQKYKMICINDSIDMLNDTDEEFESQKLMLKEAFETILPEKCSFEK